MPEAVKGRYALLDLEEALPLTHLLAPVGSCKECIAAAVDSLEADTAQAQSSVPHGDQDLGSRGFGAALQAVLRSAHIPSVPLSLSTFHVVATNAKLRPVASPDKLSGIRGLGKHEKGKTTPFSIKAVSGIRLLLSLICHG